MTTKPCYRVEVKTTNSYPADTTYGAGDDKYITCNKGILYVLCDSPADVQEIIHKDSIKAITRVGVGYDY